MPNINSLRHLSRLKSVNFKTMSCYSSLFTVLFCFDVRVKVTKVIENQDGAGRLHNGLEQDVAGVQHGLSECSCTLSVAVCPILHFSSRSNDGKRPGSMAFNK